MTGRNLEYLLKPASVALIGASNRPSSLGAAILRNLRNAAFAGPIMPVNPKHAEIDGARCYSVIADLPAAPDLAVLVAPPDTIPSLIAALGERGCKAAVVISAGFAEDAAGGGPALQQAMLDAARPHTLRIVGPNCRGVMSPRHRLNATFAPIGAKPGSLALVTQSGAIMTGILDWASARNIGFSHLVSVGAMADVDFGDLLDYLVNLNQTSLAGRTDEAVIEDWAAGPDVTVRLIHAMAVACTAKPAPSGIGVRDTWTRQGMSSAPVQAARLARRHSDA
jgi:acetyltransferase